MQTHEAAAVDTINRLDKPVETDRRDRLLLWSAPSGALSRAQDAEAMSDLSRSTGLVRRFAPGGIQTDLLGHQSQAIAEAHDS